MAEIRAVDWIAKKWATVTPQRSPDYEAGVRDPRRDWQRSTLAGTEAYKSGIQAAIGKGSFEKGVAKAGTGRWQDGAVNKGVARWGPGVALAQSAFERGFAPYQAAIKGVNLPPRYARRDPRNLLRVNAVVAAMVKVKEAQG